ncbi:MAG: hypothetical protein KDA53_12605 [Hyphomonas sp.]|nr:hypothetical protein [Hyphomonas sp.]
MALTHTVFRKAGNRPAAFTIALEGMRGTMRRMSGRLVSWLDASRSPGRTSEADLAHRDILAIARELRSDLDVFIAEMEAETADRADAA